MNYVIREVRQNEINLLATFLYEAIFIPEGVQAPSKDIIEYPDLQIYVADFGKKKDDVCYVAEVDGRVVGAVWTRIINDYGHVDDTTPSLSISLLKEYRNLGIGTELMKQILLTLKEREYKQVSLSVQKINYAVNMYEKIGFEVARENEDDYIMICKL
ncbi:GNAT family N-acetyltransferase [Streptococcus anginosus]|jgi:acetyltransferase, GNAT family|uniref:GNAT family N-acetyltransferase n=2 Tax=Streptococcus TaxID=1301 RepID=A0AAU7Q0I0_9STRE|nr:MULTISPECIES: GNAT family N-acetyltransferase [Streptococcus]MBC5618529.1 GNAT family N-acetyltransferase [Streptococcus hominis]MCW0924744.1 GNAT family N-acetyltransferase [Streptococcus anginosus]PRT69084.1 N-acetyltransferase [Streptococcus anginosus]QOG24275.1 GNAT family N-acetyltransferase [Streptococcus sp. KS 6]VTS41867.1 putative acetyltransferase [Streptococcus anginosus]